MITKERLEAKLMNAEGAAAYHLKGISSDNREFSNGSKLFREKAQEQAEILRLALAGLAVQPRPMTDDAKQQGWLLVKMWNESGNQFMVPVVLAWMPAGLGDGWRDPCTGRDMSAQVNSKSVYFPLSALGKPGV